MPPAPKLTVAAVLLVTSLAPLAARAEVGPLADDDDDSPKVTVVQLLTMGPGETIYERFGHGALCLHTPNEPTSDWCFNYGNTEYEAPGRLAWNVLRGKAVFWVSSERTDEVVSLYAGLDRTVWRQDLPLAEDQVQSVIDALFRDASPENARYAYHHIHDNCSTRLRDIIDDATGGRLSKGSGARTRRTYREIWRRGVVDSTLLLTGTDLIFGRALDVAPTRWEAMFIPAVLREEVQRLLGARPVVVYERRGRPLTGDAGSRGRGWFLVLGLLLALLPAEALRAGRRRRAALVVPSLVLGAIGAVLWSLAIVSTLAEIRWNEALLVFVPLDLAIPFVPALWRQRYLTGRLVMLAAVSALLALGLFIQPLWAPIAMVFLPLALLAAMGRGEGRAEAPTSPAR